MNRSVLRGQFFASGVSPGEVVVASGFVHPSRGPVWCPAAPAVAGGLRNVVGRVRLAEIPVTSEAADAVVFAVTYVDPRGHVAGLAVAARRDDENALAAARNTVGQWRQALRTRRVLVVRNEPVCAGARRATAMAEETAGPVHLLRQDGEVDAVPDTATVVVAAHGVGLAARAEIAARDLRVVDATCPLVADTQETVREFAGRGDTVVVIGRPDDAVTDGLTGQAPEDVRVVSSVREAGDLPITDPDRVSFVLSPGMPVDDAVPVLAALRSRFPRLRGQHPDGWCYAASDRLAAVRSVAGGSDLLLVAGEGGHELAGQPCEVRQVTDAGQLRADWLTAAATVGVVATSSAPAGLVDEIVRVLSGLGPLSVVNRQVTTDIGVPPMDESMWRCVTPGRVASR